MSYERVTGIPAGKTTSQVLFCPGCAHLLASQEATGCTYGCAQQGSLAQTSLALHSREDCGALHCSLIDMQRDPQQLLRGILSLAVGRPLSTALQPLFKLGSSQQHPLFLQKLGYDWCLRPSRLWMLKKALRSPTVLNSKRCCRLPAFSQITF